MTLCCPYLNPNCSGNRFLPARVAISYINTFIDAIEIQQENGTDEFSGQGAYESKKVYIFILPHRFAK
jgi:hypothetical protein